MTLRRRTQRSEVLRRKVMERGDGPKRRASGGVSGRYLGFTRVLWDATHCHRPSRNTQTSV